ncbi:MAG: arginase family protein [Candidatus Helarchaeota archaeon]
MSKIVKVFGAALDPSDMPQKIRIKQTDLQLLATKQKLKTEYLDPYDAFIANSEGLKRQIFKKIGKFTIESWLRPVPDLEDMQFINPLDFRIFLDSNGCKEYAEEMEKFIEEKVLPDIPLMIGADHSLTGGILNALSKKYGSKNVSLIVLDGHFDAIPTNMRLELAKYSKEHKEEMAVLFPELVDSINDFMEIPHSYNCGTFLYYLIENGIINPQKVVVFGVMDYPREDLKDILDPRVKKYVDYYLSYEDRGVKIIPNSRNYQEMIEQLANALNEIQTQYVYISFDVDISSLNAVLAARFMEFIGIDEDCLTNAIELLKNLTHSKVCELIGMDITEIEVHFLNAKLKNGKIDKTLSIMDKILEIIP